MSLTTRPSEYAAALARRDESVGGVRRRANQEIQILLACAMVREVGANHQGSKNDVELTRRIARAFVGLKMQAWDIAFTPEGPIPLEINFIGSLFLPQTADQRGI
jgi:hypothetical protein